MASIYSVADFLDLLRRRLRLILAVAFLGTVASVWFALQQQPVYSSTAVIQITRPTIAGELAPSTVEGSSARRIQLIEQRLMARGTILEIVDQLDLFADQPGLLASEIVPMMRRSVSLTGTAAAREGASDDGAISVLSITANMPTRAQAQAVAEEFSQRTIALSRSTRLDQARETLSFFNEKETALIRDISALEEELANFRYENEVTLPGIIEMRGTEIASINESLLELARQEIEIRKVAEEAAATQRTAYAERIRKDYETQVETLNAQRQLLLDRRAEMEASLELTPEVDRQLASYERRHQQMQSELEVITARRAEAEVGFRLETASQGERLTVLEPAPLPDYAVGGGRKSLALKGGLVSLVLGVIAAFAMDLRHPVLRTSAQMKRETGLSPVVTIPVLKTQPKGLAHRLRGIWTRRSARG
ncbi:MULTISPECIES: Wzz/FepE/Etk N-terminal domain-containing protein [Tritonibacter]|uniref:Uncharacterized protein involved in exopolysaccharide biosynthesis n=1 Tax=Tritonibacter scottomollicae TaxID=483013 RepID=A0A2T1ANT2_TRISK|nr:Wzz/FepE/Etk N-terminal domain-containing protein [Tritonibacter scottomollicae]PRZ50260.1 uncharacterized protein involved in exopolysaccharide biosynthesis [Tritonibacter scottomollicae]